MKTDIPSQTRQIIPILEIFKGKVKEAYGIRFHQLILYGSYARGVAGKESDIDLLVVLKDMHSAFEEIDRLNELKYSLMLDHDILLSTNPVNQETLEHSKLPLFRNILQEGIVL
ncbi:MAG: nucleotidyltransferase domain-containing protein [Bacteroidales bacterium]|nr:nucleotidyltransferase domain-containing protein [Bacteroidales bacterium]